jgi:pyridoxal phosphate enzyme (YggS family)
MSVAIFRNIDSIYKRISRAAMRAGREPTDVTLIAVTKTVGLEEIKAAIDAGLRQFGENRVQEASRKIADCRLRIKDSEISWHLIGHLQKNKAKAAVQIFDLIHSLDSLHLAEEINRHAERISKVQDVLIEVKLSPEETKHGVARDDLTGLMKAVSSLKNLHLKGLMTIPPFFEDPQDARPFFKELRELRDRAETLGFHLPELSMGMSQDFEIAIEEGATMVRIGTAIFGARR